MRTILMLTVILFASCSNKKKDEVKPDLWAIDYKRTYEYRLTTDGKVDSVIITQNKYKNSNVADSVYHLNDYSYSNNRIASIAFSKRQAGQFRLNYTTVYDYNKSGKIARIAKMVGQRPISSTEYQYDDAGNLRRQVIIGPSRINQEHESSDDNEFDSNNAPSVKTDTMVSVFNYDAGKRVVSVVTSNGRGILLRKDSTIYMGDVPYLSFSLNNVSDTVRIIRFTRENAFLKLDIKSDSFRVERWLYEGVEFGKLTHYLNDGRKYKRYSKYDEKGRVIQVILYHSVKS